MQVGDGVVFWMGDGVEKSWGIIGFGRILANTSSSQQVVIARERGQVSPITPYPAGLPTRSETTEYLRNLFGPNFRPLLKMYARLGYENVKPRVITVDSITATQHRLLLERARTKHAAQRPTTLAPVELKTNFQVDTEGRAPAHQWSKALSADEYAQGLKTIEAKVTDLQRLLLIKQYYAPNRTVFATELARMADVSGGHPIVNAQYGRLGHMFSDATGHAPDHRQSGKPRWWSVWSRGYPTRKGFIWEMLPAVAEALETLGWVTSNPIRSAEPDSSIDSWRQRIGTTELRVEGSVKRAASDPREVELVHNRLQNLLFNELAVEFGGDAVEMEKDFTDIKVRIADAVTLFEVKSDRLPRAAIRAAIGQLLEYSYAATQRGEKLRALVIAAPCPLSDQDERYFHYLREIIGIELHYRCIRDPQDDV